MRLQKTFSKRKEDIGSRDWFIVDATDVPVGRLATKIAAMLSGSAKPTFSPHTDDGDFVVVINSDKVAATGKKDNQKVYYRHSGYMGSTKSTTLGEQMEKDSTKVISDAVYGMLPKNKLRPPRMNRLKIYVDESHDHAAQSPKEIK